MLPIPLHVKPSPHSVDEMIRLTQQIALSKRQSYLRFSVHLSRIRRRRDNLIGDLVELDRQQRRSRKLQQCGAKLGCDSVEFYWSIKFQLELEVYILPFIVITCNQKLLK